MLLMAMQGAFNTLNSLDQLNKSIAEDPYHGGLFFEFIFVKLSEAINDNDNGNS